MNIMAVPKLESYGSTFFRYAYSLLSNKTPRWVEKSAHDASYNGVIRTVGELKDKGLTSNISVFVRSTDVPRKIYSTNEQQYPDAISAINFGRDIGRKKAVQDFPSKFNIVKETFETKCPELTIRLADWENLYNEEKAYFEEFNKFMEK